MTSLVDVINRPISIEGQDIVIVPDLVGPVPVSEQHQYVELVAATNTFPSISIREADVEDMRDRFPELKVFGLWQMLVHANAISLRHPLHVIKMNDLDGYYLHCDLGRAEFSGVYEAGFFAADSDFDLDEALEIEIDVSELRIPPLEAKLASELLAERRLKSQKSWRNLGIACVWVAISGVGVDFAFESFYNHEQNELKSKTAMLESLRSGLDQLRTSRLTEVPNDIKLIKSLAGLWAALPDIRSEPGLSFSDKELDFKVMDEGFDPANKIEGISSRYRPEGYWLITLKNPNRT